MSNSTPYGTNPPIVQSTSSASHPMVPPSMLLSSHSMMISDPAIRAAMRRNSKLTQISLIMLAVVSLCCLAFAVVFAVGQIRINRAEVAEAEQRSREVQHVVAQVVRNTAIDEEEPVFEERRVYFNISSIPSGASVYVDGLFVGETSDDKSLEKQFAQSNATSQVVVALDGYYVAKKSFSHASDFSDTVTLEKRPVVHAVVREKKKEDPRGESEVTRNRAVIISAGSERTTTAENPGSKKAAPPASDIILPD